MGFFLLKITMDDATVIGKINLTKGDFQHCCSALVPLHSDVD